MMRRDRNEFKYYENIYIFNVFDSIFTERELNVFHACAARELAEGEEEELRNEMLWNAESTAHDLRSTYISSRHGLRFLAPPTTQTTNLCVQIKYLSSQKRELGSEAEERGGERETRAICA